MGPLLALAGINTALNLVGKALHSDPAPTLDTKALDSQTALKIKETSQDFEAFFVSSAFQDMFAGMETDPLFGGGAGEDMFKSFLVQEYGKSVAKAGGIGVSDMVQKQLLQLQETGK